MVLEQRPLIGAWRTRSVEKALTEGDVLRGTGKKITLGQTVLGRYDVVSIDEELIFCEAPGQAGCRKPLVVCDGLRRGDEEGSVGDLDIQELQRHGIDIGAVAGHCRSTVHARLSAKLLPECCRGTVVGQRRQEVRRQ